MPFLHRTLVALFVAARPVVAAPDFVRDIRPALENFCLDCHDDSKKPKGDLNLERFTDEAAVMQDRAVWKSVFDQLEAHMMPPPKRDDQPTPEERARLMAWVKEMLARPDPKLGARDPGKPVLRRLTRLEYNNTVRDLFGLETDVFMFPERQPFKTKDYFQPASGKMADQVTVQLIEYGGRVPVLLGSAGLPGDSRAEHGFRNRGDVMNFSPLQIEQYVALAGDIVNHPELPQRSRVFAELLGIEWKPRPAAVAARPATNNSPVSPAVGVFAPAAPKLPKAEGSADNVKSRFREEVSEAFREGRGGVFDVATMAVVPHKNAAIRVPFGDAGAKTLTINPDQDIWLAPFSTAEATSAPLLLANKTKNSKTYELTFRVEDGDQGEGITRLAVCVLGRRGQTGAVTLTARFSDTTESAVTVTLAEGKAGTTFASFAAVPGETIKSLLVDGSKFSGEFVLLDDLGFVTNGARVVNARAPGRVGVPPAGAGVPPARTSATAEPPQKEAPALPSKDRFGGTPKPAGGTPTLPGPPRERLAAFLERAFRRPASDAERARFTALYESSRTAGKSEADAMRAAVQAVLASPSFLYLSPSPRHSVSPSPPIRPLDDHELASRLSYFLWATAPDEELLALAKRGALSHPDVLAAQTRRMLRDSRVRELGESFAVQWLRLDQLYTSKPDAKLFRDFYAGPQGKDTAHGAMLVEPLLLFETILVEDRSILELLDPGWSYLNPRLMKLYDLSPPQAPAPMLADAAPATGTREVKKPEKDNNALWTRTALPDKTRGGVMHMGATLTLTSLPFRTSPVKRGAWLLETIFNRPPIEPKIAFVLTDDKPEFDHKMSVRERFEAHRSKAECYSCHIRLDPPGFALEAFSPIGTVREKDGPAPVDARGEWNGRPFNGPAEFKAAVMAKPDEFVRGFIEHLLSYALGRKLEYFDMATVDEIQRAAAQDGHRFGTVIAEVVKSYPFRFTRSL
jgi:hypothetical protein